MAFASTSNLNKTLNEQSTSYLNASQSINDDNNNQLAKLTREDDEWIAVKSLDRCNSSSNTNVNSIQNSNNNEIINIVSISIEKEKIAIVTREHNRLVTDDEHTKQWYSVYTIEQLYSINQRICELDASLDAYYPDQLRPIKGLLSTYFTDKLNAPEHDNDLQDNHLCNSFSLYLSQAYKSLGKRMYVDILFNDVNSDQYFEIYSEFNLKRIRNQIEQLKQNLFTAAVQPVALINKQLSQHQSKVANLKVSSSSLNELIRKQNEECELQHKLLLKQQIFSNLKHALNSYSSEDNQIENLVNLFAEYYTNLQQPMWDSLELAKVNLNKYSNKLVNQERSSKVFNTESTASALANLKSCVDSARTEIALLTANIDSIHIEYKQNLIDLYTKLLNKLKLDRDKFIQPSLNLNLTSLFDVLTKKRKEKLESDVSELRIQTYNLQLGLLEKRKENENNRLNEINKQIINLKLQLHSEEELVLKRKLNKLNENETVIQMKETQLKSLLNESVSSYTDFKIEEIKEIISKIDLNSMREENDVDIEDYELELADDDDEDDSEFYDAYDDPLVLIQEEAKEKQLKQNEMNAIKKKIIDIGSKKSSLRISLSKLNEAEKEKIKLEAEAEKMNETDKLSQTNISITKSTALKKQEDELQSKENIENRRKALQRIREHKMKHIKDSLGSSNDSLASIQSTATTSTIVVKKPYVPKSKQRILPPPPKPRQSKPPTASKASTTFEVKLNDLNDDETKLDEDEIKSSNLNTQQQHQVKLSESEIFNFKPSISSSVNLNHDSTLTMPAPPPPPPLPSFMTSSTISSTLPLPNIPPPPPPPPPFMSSFEISSNLPLSSIPPPPPPPPFLASFNNELSTNKPSSQKSPPAPLLFSSDSFKNELKLAKTTPKSTNNKNKLKPIDNSTNHNRSFDINEIKTFKFKATNTRVNVKERPILGSQNMNPWDSLMNEIRSNGGNKLKKVSDSPTSKSSKHMKFNNDDNLVRDLNQILSQRSQFFKDDDDNESSDDESWSGFVNN